MNTVKVLVVLVLSAALAFAQGHNKPEEPHANCCLCMCHAKDETLCSKMCIRLQHGKKIVYEPEMDVCTKECARVHVKTVEYDSTQETQ
jgi:hypothetical protein